MLSRNIKVDLGAYVGGGTSLSILKTFHDAYKISSMDADSQDALIAFYLATLGAAKALKLENKIGNFENDNEADFIVVDINQPSILS